MFPPVPSLMILGAALSLVVCLTGCSGDDTSTPPPTTATSTTRTTTTRPRATTSTRPGSYTIQSGDSLAEIARRFGVTVDELIAANGIVDPNVIQAGQVLTIPPAPVVVTTSTIPTTTLPATTISG